MQKKLISSSANLRFREWLSLHSSKGIHKSQSCLVSGIKTIQELIKQHPNLCQTLIFQDGTPTLPADLEFTNLDDLHIELFSLPKPLFSELDLLGTHSPLLIAKLPEIKTWREESPIVQSEILVPLGDPTNLGALLRTSAAFEFKKIVILKESAHPFHPKVIRSAVGAQFSLDLSWGPSIHELKLPVIALDMKGKSLNTFSWPEQFRLLVGEEGKGVPSQLKGDRISIPMSSTSESLNATVATSIALYTAYQK